MNLLLAALFIAIGAVAALLCVAIWMWHTMDELGDVVRDLQDAESSFVLGAEADVRHVPYPQPGKESYR